MRSGITPSWRCGCSTAWTLQPAPPWRRGWRAISRRRCRWCNISLRICRTSPRRCADTRCFSSRPPAAVALPPIPVVEQRPLPHRSRRSRRRQASRSTKPAVWTVEPKHSRRIAARFDDVAGELNELFFAATEDERRLILLNLDVAAPLSAGHIAIRRDPTIGQRLEAAALGNHREDFAKQSCARAAHSARAGPPHRPRRSRRAASWSPSRRSACRATCSIASCCSSIRRSAIRSSASTRWRALRRDDRAGGGRHGRDLAGAAQRARRRREASAAALERRAVARPAGQRADPARPQTAPRTSGAPQVS